MDGRAHVRLSPRDMPMTHRELLATRVLSVDAYWQELRESRGRQPREIPVPLWPGESVAQYEREFGRWLASRRLSLAAMREDPVGERNCRVQFAQTRVARPNESRQQQQQQGLRAPSRSRSRSPSLQQPRRIGIVSQHRAYRGDTRVHSSFDNRAPTENGRPYVARRAGERQCRERSYSRERPQAHGNWQQVQNAAPSQRQYTRDPSPRGAQQQPPGDAQRWRSSPPRYRAASPPPSERLSPPVRRSASPQHSFTQHMSSADIRKELLARRVVSVEAFRDEMYKLRNGFIREDDLKRPHETMVRIPASISISYSYSFALAISISFEVKVKIKIIVSKHSKELREGSTANASFLC
ncbi:hypothetical protein PR003_g8055 [Phytophthora rubi]|uniref:Uncharacterized protein n=1 Tax=Phytophthora rubi TaxID=129364 RepID=A0A6A3N538_9STRA|nr:hypothetical protein PR001_g7521 [Phytophthora rubi]KAE9345222.1 hypothetical protein PR003_g8055 [Phytophthora rubi]